MERIDGVGDGVVYFIQQGRRGPIKIGRTADLEARLASLREGSAKKLSVLVSVADKSPYREDELHRQFADFRLRGEWFKPHPLLLELIDSISSCKRNQPLLEGQELAKRVAALIATRPKKLCSVCETEKEIRCFYKHKNGLQGTMAMCKKCYRDKFATEYFAQYRQSNNERLTSKRKQYRLTAKLRALHAFGHECVCCGESMTACINVVTRDKKPTLIDYESAALVERAEVQVLCYNCWNAEKAFGWCPHSTPFI